MVGSNSTHHHEQYSEGLLIPRLAHNAAHHFPAVASTICMAGHACLRRAQRARRGRSMQFANDLASLPWPPRACLLHTCAHTHGHGPGAPWLAPDASCGGLCPTITSAPRSTSRPCSGASLMSPGIMQALLQTARRRGTLSYNQGSCIDATTSLTPLLHGSWLVALVVG